MLYIDLEKVHEYEPHQRDDVRHQEKVEGKITYIPNMTIHSCMHVIIFVLWEFGRR